ncbi:MAG: hypothetical protein IKO35_01590 [Elusimicrobiaceae bacterium]|nr:hypothetical protein [Elusimicrobiaceae bacterium]
MKKLFLLILIAVFSLTACRTFRIGPKGEGEYVTAESLVPYDENNLRQMKKEGILAAQKAAVEKVAGVFISSATTVDQAQLVEDKIVSKSAGFIRHSRVQKAYRKGDEFYTKIKAMVLVKDIGEIIKQSESDAFAKKTTILVASRETVGDDISLRQDCKQAIYRALKNQPFALVNGDNLSQNNIENPNASIDKARTEGARFIIVAEAATSPLDSLTTSVTSPFKTYRARANMRVYSTNNYAAVAEGSQQQSGLDPLPEIAAQKSIAAACEAAAKQLAEPINSAINSAKIFSLTVKDVNTIERLKQIQDIFKDLREIEDFNLVRYANSSAQFDISANIATPEELAAKIIRKYNVNFTVVSITPSAIVLSFN